MRQEKKREANAYGRAMEIFIALILATGCPAMRVCPTLHRTFIDCVVWAYPSLPDLLKDDQFFDPDGTFDNSLYGYINIAPSMGIEVRPPPRLPAPA